MGLGNIFRILENVEDFVFQSFQESKSTEKLRKNYMFNIYRVPETMETSISHISRILENVANLVVR